MDTFSFCTATGNPAFQHILLDGLKVALNEAMGSTQSIMVGSDGELYGASDSRLVDDLTAGY
ncbi:hypothetical protein ABVZ39_004546 [Escherichia coli]